MLSIRENSRGAADETSARFDLFDESRGEYFCWDACCTVSSRDVDMGTESSGGWYIAAVDVDELGEMEREGGTR